jgi:hypothetical protein
LEDPAMMGERTVLQESLFYSFNLDRHVPMDHLLRSVGRLRPARMYPVDPGTGPIGQGAAGRLAG